jgi:hypothetical protein
MMTYMHNLVWGGPLGVRDLGGLCLELTGLHGQYYRWCGYLLEAPKYAQYLASFPCSKPILGTQHKSILGTQHVAWCTHLVTHNCMFVTSAATPGL